MTVFTKVGSNFVQAFKSPAMDSCDAIKGTSIGRFMKNVVNYLKEHAPSLVRQCPFGKGKLEIQNLSLDLKYLKFFPAGEYKNIVHFYDKIDNNILTLTYIIKLDSNK